MGGGEKDSYETFSTTKDEEEKLETISTMDVRCLKRKGE